MASQKQLADQINRLGDVVKKIGNETSSLKQKVADLETALENQADVSPELQEAVDAVTAQLKVVDDLVADAPSEPTEPPNPPEPS